MVDKLTQERLAQVREIFSMYDLDNDDAIPARQVIVVLRAVGYNPAEQEVKELTEEFDPEGESMIDFPTFLELMVKVKREGESESEIEEAFRVFDPSGTGVISASDLRQIMTSMGEKLSEEEANEMVAFADSYEKGEVHYRELIKALFSE